MSATAPNPGFATDPVRDDRTPAQVAHERAMTEVSETLMNIEQSIRRVKRAQAEVARIGYRGGAAQALADVFASLTQARDQLFQAAYFVPAPTDEPNEPTSLFPDLTTPAERQQRLI